VWLSTYLNCKIFIHQQQKPLSIKSPYLNFIHQMSRLANTLLRPYSIWRNPQRGPEAERFLGIIRRKDRQYLPLYRLPNFWKCWNISQTLLIIKVGIRYTKRHVHNVCVNVNRLTDWLNVFIITSDKPQMKLHEQFINDKVWTIKLGLLLAFT